MKSLLPLEVQLLLALEETKMLTAKTLISQMQRQGLHQSLSDAEFHVFSQWGDDGIIQYLIHHLDIQPHTFIEFGVEDYAESNTRFLLMNNNWRGLIIDSDEQNIERLQSGEYYWRHDLTAVCSFVDRDNINGIFIQHGFQGAVGILSIDIDGNDYWVWEAITAVDPILVIVEYNSVFGATHAITIPYDPRFQRTQAHYSNLYFGASLKALCLLGHNKGYTFIGSNSAGCNAYFVKTDHLGSLKAMDGSEGYVQSRFRESQYPGGGNSYIGGQERLHLISNMLVNDVEHGVEVAIKELL